MNTDINKDKKLNIRSIVAGDNYSVQRGENRDASGFAASGMDKDWVNIVTLFRCYKGQWAKALINDEMRIRIQFFITYVILGLVSLGMTVLNAFTAWKILGYATFAFFILSIINVIFCLISAKTEKAAHVLFAIEIVALCTYFAISGNPEGFSVLWSLLLPTCGMMLFGRRYGTVVALVQLAVLVLLFWIGAGKGILMYDYTQSFLQRFPLLYLACFFVGSFFETIRHNTHDELMRTREQFEYLYKHDALTGLYNRYGLNAEIAESAVTGKNIGRAFAIADLDHFKRTNDIYGHLIGDEVLKTSAGIIRSVVGGDGYVCRWGGEEFSIVFFDETKAEEICRRINRAIADHEYGAEGAHFRNTISIGLVVSSGSALPYNSAVITQADENLYTSKMSGRNRVTVSVMRDGGDTPAPDKNVQQAV